MTHEGEGDCTIWVLLFEDKGEVHVMAKGMDIKLHVVHGGENKEMQRLEENIMGINGFLQLSVQRQYHIYPHVFSFLS